MDCTGIYDQQYDIGDTEVLKKMIIPPKLWNCFFPVCPEMDRHGVGSLLKSPISMGNHDEP